jgi:hypothetical protein
MQERLAKAEAEAKASAEKAKAAEAARLAEEDDSIIVRCRREVRWSMRQMLADPGQRP